MARDQEPMTDEEFEALAADLDELQRETREALAEEVGGDPEHDAVGEGPVPDGGE